MNTDKISIQVETEGMEEATEKAQELSSALEAFPAQVVIKHCRDCTISIYPTQYIKGGDE